MVVAGTSLTDDDFFDLVARARTLGDVECATRLEGAYYRDVRLLHLSAGELRALLQCSNVASCDERHDRRARPVRADAAARSS